MRVIRTQAELRAWSREVRQSGLAVSLTPTMGALHEGHLSLVRAARRRGGVVAASIFVNPTQFAPTEDFSLYPRTFDEDCRMLEAEGVEAVFAPGPEEMYPAGTQTFVEVAGLSGRLDGASRPGHFRGVATIVAKLLIACEPDRAYFGQKDAAQVAVLRRMVADLGLPVEVAVCPIVRESDGLAMSSRNRFLNPEERRQARVLRRALDIAERMVQAGERRAEVLVEAARRAFAAEPAVRVDYIAMVDWATLTPLTEWGPGALFAVAAWVGATRLIDNVAALGSASQWSCG